MEFKIRHLEMIQNIIQRMANNSFLLKGWTVSLIVAIYALADSTMSQVYFVFTYIPVIMFWFLDSYYLQIERKFVALYNDVRQKEIIDFNLSIEEVNYKNIGNKHLRYINCLFSTSEWLFYVTLAILLTIMYGNEFMSAFGCGK